jgi:putative FmdB family regulatory protein
MPTYVYACDACGAQFEQFQRFADEPLKVCPRCHESGVRRVFQPVGVVFKGSGWYITDSRKSSDSGEKAADTAAKDGGEKAADTAAKDGGEKAADTAAKDGGDAKPAKAKPADTKPAAPAS